MTRIDRARYVGGLAACLLAASAFAPMMTASLSSGVHWQPFGWQVRVMYLALAACAALASLLRAFWVAGFIGAFGFANGLLLLALTHRGVVDSQVQSWLRPGWGFVPLLTAGATLAFLPLWARLSRQVDRPSA